MCRWESYAGAVYVAPDGTITIIPPSFQYVCTTVFSSNPQPFNPPNPPTGGGGDKFLVQNLSPVAAERERIRQQAKANCIKRKQSENRKAANDYQNKRSSKQRRDILGGCVFMGGSLAVKGFWGGGIVGLVTGPGAPLVGVGGAIVGGILGCGVGVLGAGAKSVIEDSLDPFVPPNVDIEKDCEEEANDAVAQNQ